MTPGGAVSQLRFRHIRVPPQVQAPSRRNLSVAPSITLCGGDRLGHAHRSLRMLQSVCLRRRRLECGASVCYVLRGEQHGRACGGIREPDPRAAGCADTDCRGEGRAHGERKGLGRVPRRRYPESSRRGAGWAVALRMLRTWRLVFLRTGLGASLPELAHASGWEAISQSAAARAELSRWTLFIVQLSAGKMGPRSHLCGTHSIFLGL